MQIHGEKLKEFQKLVEQYNRCFYDKDIVVLRQMYVADAAFFQTAGDIQALIIEGLTAYRAGDGACVVLTLRYSSQPRPGVRTTMFLENQAHAPFV